MFRAVTGRPKIKAVFASSQNMAFGVENTRKVRKGEKIDPVIDTGTVLVTKDNAADYK